MPSATKLVKKEAVRADCVMGSRLQRYFFTCIC